MASTFALTPAKAHDGVLDFTNAEEPKVYEAATKPLYPKDDGFDCKPENLHGLLELLAGRGEESN